MADHGQRELGKNGLLNWRRWASRWSSYNSTVIMLGKDVVPHFEFFYQAVCQRLVAVFFRIGFADKGREEKGSETRKFIFFGVVALLSILLALLP